MLLHYDAVIMRARSHMNYSATIDTCIHQLFVVPAFFLLITAVALCRETYLLSCIYRKKIVNNNGLETIARIVSAIGLCALLWINCRILKRGVYLPFEEESQAVSLIGMIDHIERDKISSRFFPSFETDATYSYGGTMIIDGESYYCLSTLGWQAGDVVSFSFLPKSRIILHCEKCSRQLRGLNEHRPAKEQRPLRRKQTPKPVQSGSGRLNDIATVHYVSWPHW